MQLNYSKRGILLFTLFYLPFYVFNIRIFNEQPKKIQ